jgi:hypothetical protein
MGKLPKNPKKGSLHTITAKGGRKMTFMATGKVGFGAWKIMPKAKKK